jgi:hypothetical protein
VDNAASGVSRLIAVAEKLRYVLSTLWGDPMAVTTKVSADDMAAAVGVDPKAFRQALRSANLAWHSSRASWVVERDSPQHDDMKTVLVNLLKARREARRP